MSVKAILLKARRINASRVSNSSSDSLRVNVILITNVAIQIAFDGYPLDSPRHNRLWFMRVNKMRKREGLLALTTVRLKVEENQLVGVFDEIGFVVDALKGA